MFEQMLRAQKNSDYHNNGVKKKCGVTVPSADLYEWAQKITYDSISEIGFGYKPDTMVKGKGDDVFIQMFDQTLEMSLS